jgi:virginiamycin B lyase
MLGRLDPATGEIRLVPSPTAHSLPYGFLVNSQGVPFFAEFGANKIARVVRIAAASDDAIWYTDYVRGYLGRLDPKTGKVAEWLSPSGPDSAIAVVDDVV